MYIVTEYPEKKIFKDIESLGDNNSYVSITENGLVTAEEPGAAIVAVSIEDYLHVSRIVVRDAQEQAYEEKMNRINEEVEAIAKRFSGLSDVEKVLGGHDYLINLITYDITQTGKDGRYEAIVEHKAVCRGYAIGFKVLMDYMGIKSELVSGKVGEESHAWNRVELDDEWYYLDLTWDDKGNQANPYISHRYF